MSLSQSCRELLFEPFHLIQIKLLLIMQHNLKNFFAVSICGCACDLMLEWVEYFVYSCVCMPVYIVFVCQCISVRTCGSVSERHCIFASFSMLVFACVCTYVCMPMYQQVRACVYVFVCVCMRVGVNRVCVRLKFCQKGYRSRLSNGEEK